MTSKLLTSLLVIGAIVYTFVWWEVEKYLKEIEKENKDLEDHTEE